jgi:hypothetical protein
MQIGSTTTVPSTFDPLLCPELVSFQVNLDDLDLIIDEISSTSAGEVLLEPWGDIEIYNWDGQTHCPRTDCFEA